MSRRRSQLPEVLAELVEVAGSDAAWALVRARGGTTVYLPREVGADHWLVKAVGEEASVIICRHFSTHQSGAYLTIPTARLCQQRLRLIKALEDGASAAEAALVSGMHERSAYRTRKRLKDDKQGNLF
ncbi:MAG: helix-turn-helix domain-containing protein [Aquamicrobium sp.]|nr:helix-turn-helix domain-containing protein [Aquamicrobium sp.]